MEAATETTPRPAPATPAEALAELDKDLAAVRASLNDCADYVNSGELDPNEVMLRMHQLAADLMSGAGA